MTLKEQIQEQEKKVENYESKIKEIDKLIEKCEKELKEHQSRQSLGVTQLLLDIVQPLATYNALDGTLQSISTVKDIEKLKSERNSLNTSLTLFKSSLAKMKQQEYEKIHRAKLAYLQRGHCRLPQDRQRRHPNQQPLPCQEHRVLSVPEMLD